MMPRARTGLHERLPNGLTRATAVDSLVGRGRSSPVSGLGVGGVRRDGVGEGGVGRGWGRCRECGAGVGGVRLGWGGCRGGGEVWAATGEMLFEFYCCCFYCL